MVFEKKLKSFFLNHHFTNIQVEATNLAVFDYSIARS